MPARPPSIVITNSPISARRVVDCEFHHDGLIAHIEIPEAFGPEISTGLEQAKAQRLLKSISDAFLERLSGPHNPIIVVVGDIHGGSRDVNCLFEHDGVRAQVRIANAVSSEGGAGAELVDAKAVLLSMFTALRHALDRQ